MVNLDYLYNPEAAKPLFDKNYFVDKKLGFQVIENGTILPYKDDGLGGLAGALGGISDHTGKFIKSSFVMDIRRDGRGYTPPQNLFKKATILSYTSDIFIPFGVMQSLIISVDSGF